MNQSRIILMGQDDAPYIGYGWFGIDRSPEEMLFRAAGKQAIFKLPLESENVELSLLTSARPLHTGEAMQFGINRDGERILTWLLHTNGWTVRSGKISNYRGEDLMLEADNPWSPDNLYKNGDSRMLGVLVSSIRVSFV